jgi:hypothetical protein
MADIKNNGIITDIQLRKGTGNPTAYPGPVAHPYLQGEPMVSTDKERLYVYFGGTSVKLVGVDLAGIIPDATITNSPTIVKIKDDGTGLESLNLKALLDAKADIIPQTYDANLSAGSSQGTGYAIGDNVHVTISGETLAFSILSVGGSGEVITFGPNNFPGLATLISGTDVAVVTDSGTGTGLLVNVNSTTVNPLDLQEVYDAAVKWTIDTVTTVGDPGSDLKVPTEKAVRAAIEAKQFPTYYKGTAAYYVKFAASETLPTTGVSSGDLAIGDDFKKYTYTSGWDSGVAIPATDLVIGAYWDISTDIDLSDLGQQSGHITYNESPTPVFDVAKVAVGVPDGTTINYNGVGAYQVANGGISWNKLDSSTQTTITNKADKIQGYTLNATVNVGGTGYAVGDIVQIVAQGITLDVEVLTETGGVPATLGVQNNPHLHNLYGTNLVSTGGTGTGLTVDLTATAATGSPSFNLQDIDNYYNSQVTNINSQITNINSDLNSLLRIGTFPATLTAADDLTAPSTRLVGTALDKLVVNGGTW